MYGEKGSPRNLQSLPNHRHHSEKDTHIYINVTLKRYNSFSILSTHFDYELKSSTRRPQKSSLTVPLHFPLMNQNQPMYFHPS